MDIKLIKELIKVLWNKYTEEELKYFYEMGLLRKEEYDSLLWRKQYEGKGQEKVVKLPGGVELVLNYIPPGTFMMGSPEDERGRFAEETQHEVTLTQGYWLGKYPVTQAQYDAVMGTNPSRWEGADLPVEQVSWNDAMEFCAKLTASEKAAGRLPEGYEYTLPTEAQWEYACRARTTTAFNNGTNISSEEQGWEEEPCPNLDEVGWYEYNSDSKTHPVGQKLPNAWGLYDMHGNVWEWCLDCCKWDECIDEMVTDTYEDGIKDPLCTTGMDRVIRGGSWFNCANRCRSAYRYCDFPGRYDIGFRVALSCVQ